MSAVVVLNRLRGMGLTLTADGGDVRLGPRNLVTDEVRELVRADKAGLLLAIDEDANSLHPQRLAGQEEAAELSRLVPLILAGAPDEHGEALALALLDPAASLLSFRLIAAERATWPREGMPGDRRRCTQCANLSNSGRCLAAWRGEIVASRDYQPAKEVLRRCEGFKAKAADPDQRSGS